DGSKILNHFLPYNAREWFIRNQYMMYIIFLVIWVTGIAGMIISPAIEGVTLGIGTLIGKIFGVDLVAIFELFGIG
ncbi:MAG: hypothetical protein IKN09_04055, partial [Clostridia bacterium]|nr:hypothetical protein [Clostridia bacterium]